MNRTKKKKDRPVTHDQWIEISRQDGQTISTFYPPNAEFERLRQECDPPPVLIYRRLNFVDGVPMEYWWTRPNSEITKYGGHFLIRLKVEDWLLVMEQERAHGGAYVMPSANHQPRPVELGPCPCEYCTRKAILSA